MIGAVQNLSGYAVEDWDAPRPGESCPLADGHGPDQGVFVAPPLGISSISPRPGSKTRDRTPRLQATVSANHNLRKRNIRLVLDGRRIRDFTYKAARDKLSYTTKRLAYGRHKVNIVASIKKVTRKGAWRFKVVR